MKAIVLLLILLLLVPTASAKIIGDFTPITGKTISLNEAKEATDKQENQPIDGTILNNTKPSNSTVETSVKQISSDEGLSLGKSMISGGIIDTGFLLADYFLSSAFSMSSAGLQDNLTQGSKELTYSLYAEEINPFDIKIIKDFLLITGSFYAICLFNAIWISLAVFAYQYYKPQRFSEIRRDVLGSEGYFDIFSLVNVYAFWLLWPIGCLGFIIAAIYGRNFIISGMVTQIIKGISISSQSFPNYFIMCAGFYFNVVQKKLALFGVDLLITLVFVIGIVLGFMMICFSQSLVKKTIKVLACYFLLLLVMDIITVFFIWLGVGIDNVLAAIIFAVVVNTLILLLLVIHIVSKTVAGKMILNYIPGI